MATPSKIACPAGVWTKVADTVQTATIWKTDLTVPYLHTHVLAGASAPSSDATAIDFEDPYFRYVASEEIDIYVKAQNQAGAVRVDSLGILNQVVLKLDSLTGAQTIIDYEHHEIHSGSHYFVEGYADLNSSDDIVFAVTVPNTGILPHMLFGFESLKQFTFQVHEGATITGGTPVTAINNNRNSTKTSSMTIVSDPTVSAAGTSLYIIKLGTTDGPGSSRSGVGGSASRADEIILDSDTTYTFTFVSLEDANTINYKASWYEEDHS